jgi:deoxyribodipyrimidine photo-lyase
MKTAIVWFKTDLRLYDNEALVTIAQGEKNCL